MAKKKKKTSKIATKSSLNHTAKQDSIAKQLLESTSKPYLSLLTFFKSSWIQICVIILVSLAIYAQTYNYEYVLDDAIVITDNDYTQKGISGIPEIFTTESFQGYFKEQKDLLPGARYRPLSIASFAIEKEIFGQSSGVGHMLNMVFYTLVCILLLRLLKMLFPSQKDTLLFGFAFMATLIFTIHPLHTEAVANVKGRDEIFVILFSIISTIYCVKAIHKRFWINTLLGMLMLFVGLMAKENAITFLAIIPITQYFFTKASIKQIGITIFALLIPIIGYLLIRYSVIGYFMDSGQEQLDIMNNPFVGMNSNQTFATIFYTLGIYFKLAFFPHPLTHDYYPYHIPILGWSDLRAIASCVLYILMGVVALILLPRKHVVSYCIIVYLAALSIVSNLFFTVGTFMNERFLIISTIGSSIFSAYLFRDVFGKLFKKHGNKVGIAIFTIYSLGLLSKSITRVPAWKSPLTLNSAAIKVSKNSARANTFMCTALFNKALQEQNRDEKLRLLNEAKGYAKQATMILPRYQNGNKMRAGVAAEIWKLDNDLDKLLQLFDEVLMQEPAVGFVYEFLEYLNRIGANPSKMLTFYYNTGFNNLSKKQNKHDWALKVLDTGLQVDPNDVNINTGMGQIYHLLGSLNKSHEHFKRAGKAE